MSLNPDLCGNDSLLPSSAELFYDAETGTPSPSKRGINEGGGPMNGLSDFHNDNVTERDGLADSVLVIPPPASTMGLSPLAAPALPVVLPPESSVESDSSGRMPSESYGVVHFSDSESALFPQPPANQEVISSFVSQLAHPKSLYGGYEPPLPISRERDVVSKLLAEVSRQEEAKDPKDNRGESSSTSASEEYFVEFELSEFSIYLPENKHHPFQLRPLQHLVTKQGVSSFLFDGVLSCGSVRRYVQRVPFEICSIGNYGVESHSVDGNIWIKSNYNSKSEVYYRLKNPAPEYVRFYTAFLWLADLAKHFVDYCHSFETSEVSVFNFQDGFSHWACEHHGESLQFRDWYQQYGGGDDFRQAVAANIQFLFKESIGVDEGLRSQPIWSELLGKDAIPKQPMIEKKTVVTPYVYECFKGLRFGSQLKSVEPMGIAKTDQVFEAARLHLPKTNQTQAQALNSDVAVKRRAVRVGDVLSVTKDGTGSVWKDELSRYKTVDQCWYVYVQAIHKVENEEPSFDAIWLYKPSDTSCAKMKYPFKNELFMSDNCICGKNKIMSDEVINIESVLWSCGPPKSNRQLFIRQTYLENQKFVTLTEEHKLCQHLQPNDHISAAIQYAVGLTVLVPAHRKGNYRLEPHEIIEYMASDRGQEKVVIRQLLRRQEVDGTGRPNELVYSNKTCVVVAKKLERSCLVRFYTEADIVARNIPAPYSKDGAGNAFYITTRLCDTPSGPALIPIQRDLPKSLIQGFDPRNPPSRSPLRGMDLYCGGGNFGRGIEEGGAVRNEWGVDIYDAAIHTYHANLKHRDSAKLFFGSVNDLLIQALRGNPNNSSMIPRPKDVEFISAGSPCQGFSILNTQRDNDNGLRNQSLVASVAAYIDFYRPKYGLLENVMTMAQSGRGRDQDVLSQLICTIVGLGYQLQLFVLDAWSCGSPQSRSRLFVSFAAPGLEPLEHPGLSHSHPPSVTDRSLGKLANGQSFSERRIDLTPFKYVTAGEATKHLPKIGDGNVYQCTSFPYHMVAHGISGDMKSQIDVIPKYPRGMNFAKTWNEGKGSMTRAQRDLFPYLTKEGKVRSAVQPISRAWGRVNPNGIFPTVVVRTTPWDSRMGTCIHWDEDRYITVAEAQVAQGFPDNEVLVGDPRDWWKILGNSVCRNVSLALGLSLREAWLKNPSDFGSTIWPPKVCNTVSEALTRNATAVTKASPRVQQNTPIRPGSIVQRLQTSVKVQVTTESMAMDESDPRLLGSRITTIQIQEGFQSQNHALGEQRPVLPPKRSVSLPLANGTSLSSGRGLTNDPPKSLKRSYAQLQEKRELPTDGENINDIILPALREARILPPKVNHAVARLGDQDSVSSSAKDTISKNESVGGDNDDQLKYFKTTESETSISMDSTKRTEQDSLAFKQGKVAYSSQPTSNVQLVINISSGDESEEEPLTKKPCRRSLPNPRVANTTCS